MKIGEQWSKAMQLTDGRDTLTIMLLTTFAPSLPSPEPTEIEMLPPEPNANDPLPMSKAPLSLTLALPLFMTKSLPHQILLHCSSISLLFLS